MSSRLDGTYEHVVLGEVDPDAVALKEQEALVAEGLEPTGHFVLKAVPGIGNGYLVASLTAYRAGVEVSETACDVPAEVLSHPERVAAGMKVTSWLITVPTEGEKKMGLVRGSSGVHVLYPPTLFPQPTLELAVPRMTKPALDVGVAFNDTMWPTGAQISLTNTLRGVTGYSEMLATERGSESMIPTRFYELCGTVGRTLVKTLESEVAEVTSNSHEPVAAVLEPVRLTQLEETINSLFLADAVERTKKLATEAADDNSGIILPPDIEFPYQKLLPLLRRFADLIRPALS